MDAPPQLDTYDGMDALEQSQKVIIELPEGAHAHAGTDSVIMEVVCVDGNKIHFTMPGDVGGEQTTQEVDVELDHAEVEEREETTLVMPTAATADISHDEEDMEEVEVTPCFLCCRSTHRPLTMLLRGRTASTACSLAERLSGCVAPLRLSVSTADAVCATCVALINAADSHYHQYQLASEQIGAMVQAEEAGTGLHRSEPDGQASAGGQTAPTHVKTELKLSPSAPAAADEAESSDDDWTPSTALRSSRGRTPRAVRRWSPEPIAQSAAAPAVKSEAGAAPRGRGRPRKQPPASPARQPMVIEYHDIDTLKEQVKDIKTPKFNLKTKRPLKADLEKIIHLEVRAADVREPPAADGRQRQASDTKTANRVSTFECRRCNIQFQDSAHMVRHLRQHVSKPWCRRCRTEFSDRSSLLQHRRLCRLQHRSGMCTMCNREVKYYRYHLKRHAELVELGRLEQGAPLPPDEDTVPPSVQRPPGKYLAGGVCSICGQHVPTRLRKHEKLHKITHTCPICKKTFTREDVVRGHIKRVHMKERPHICAHCGKTFVSVYSMQRHEMIHNNEYRFYCQECGDGFRQKQQLTAHMRNKHGVVDVVFEDVQVMPEGTAVVDAMAVVADDGAVYQSAVVDPYDKQEYVIATADGDQPVRFTTASDDESHIYQVSAGD